MGRERSCCHCASSDEMAMEQTEMEICNRFGKHFGGRIAVVFGSQLKIINAKRSGRDGPKQWFALGCVSESSWGSPLPQCSGHTWTN